MPHWCALWIKKKRMWHTVGVHEGKRAMSFKSSRPLTTKRRLTRVQHGILSATILTPSLPSSFVQVTKHLCPSLLKSQNSLWPAARPESGPSSPEEVLSLCHGWTQGPSPPSKPQKSPRPSGRCQAFQGILRQSPLSCLIQFLILTFNSGQYNFPCSFGTPLEGT